MQRREILKSAAGTGAGLLILPSGTLFGQNRPSNKLNLALLGVAGRGTAHYEWMMNENVVAVCDVNENRLKEGVQIFPGAKTYVDWRRLLDQKDVEAVVICTADHHHAFIANWALNRGMHVFCEKPLGICVDEVRTVRATYLKQKAKLATQHGTQRHAFPNFERVRELVLDGAIGDLKSISGWDSRQAPRPGYPPEGGEPPSFFHYDQWVGPSAFHPYSPQYFVTGCMSWNEYRDFGVGQMGDMGAHTMDLLWNAIDAGAPTSIEVDQKVSDKYNPDINPVKLKVTFEHPKNSWRGPVTVVWYQGGLKPNSPENYVDVTRIANGAVFEGTKGFIVCDFNTRVIIPSENEGNMTYYHPRSEQQLLPLIGGTGEVRAYRPPAPPTGRPAVSAQQLGPDGFLPMKLVEGNIPASMVSPNPGLKPPATRPGAVRETNVFQKEWADACKGKSNNVTHGTSSKTHCDFDYSGTMMEQMLLGLVAHRAGQKLLYDPATGRVTNMPEANEWLKRTYRPGWTLNG